MSTVSTTAKSATVRSQNLLNANPNQASVGPHSSTTQPNQILSHLCNSKTTPEKKTMKLVWSPESASRAYIDTVKSCGNFQDSGVAEFLSAMAAGWNAKLIVEAWSYGGAIATSVGLAVAARHTNGRHVCIIPDERSRSAYVKAMYESGVSATEMVVGDAAEVMVGLVGVEFLVVDCKRKDFARVLRFARFSHKGAVLACKNACQRAGGGGTLAGFRWHGVLERGTRVVRSVFLPLEEGLDIAHVGSTARGENPTKSRSRWIKHIDHRSGEEHVFRGQF